MSRPVEPITCGHPERPHRALGMCSVCYWRNYRRLDRERRDRRDREAQRAIMLRNKT